MCETQVGQLQQRDGRVRTVGHGQAYGGGPIGVRTGQRDRLFGEQLRGRAREVVRVQKVPGTHPEDGRLGVPGRRVPGRLPRTVSELSVQVPLVRLRRHRRIRVQAQSSFQGHVVRHTGKRGKKNHLITIAKYKSRYTAIDILHDTTASVAVSEISIEKNFNVSPERISYVHTAQQLTVAEHFSVLSEIYIRI